MKFTNLNLGVLVLALGAAAIAVGQSSPTDVAPSQAAIVWTGMQQPVPEPAQDTSAREIPPAHEGAQQNTERSPEQREQPDVKRPGQNPEQATPGTSADAANVRSVTGTVVREGKSYFLRTDDNSEYQLDDATKVQDFENQSVRITGTVDSSTRTVHVQTIKPNT